MYRTAKSPRMAHPGQIGLPGSGKTPSRKRALNGRFVQFLCHVCGDVGTVQCPNCNGSGEGMADGSVCQHCYPIKGSGSLPCPEEEHEGDTHVLR